MKKPTILVLCDVKLIDDYTFHMVGEKYVNAVAHAANANPILMPAWGKGIDLGAIEYDLAALLPVLDGVCLPGSITNVHPSHYHQNLLNDKLELDAQRDTAAFPIIHACIEVNIPLLAICRGFQELNVALGGSLHQAVANVPGFNNHSWDDEKPREEQYLPSHRIKILKDCLLHRILDQTDLAVNSLHHQGIEQLAPGLHADAISEDGLIEAVSLPGHFVLGVQWHPEWSTATDSSSRAIFSALGEAARLRSEAKAPL